MNMIINLFGKFVTIVDIKTRKVIGIIENDVGLIRYILKIFREYEISSNNNGYLQFQNKEGETYLHRIVIEYYSKFDTNLLNILKDTKHHQVNHKNKMKWDNRLENLEIVTIKGNQLHKNNKEYKKEIVFETQDLIKIKEKLKEDKQYEADKKYLEKVSKRNKDYLSEKHIYSDSRKYLYNHLYIRFNNVTVTNKKILSNTTISNMLDNFTYIIFMDVENTFFNKLNMKILNEYYDKFRYKNILLNNLKLIEKYYHKNKYFKSICNKYHLFNDELNLKSKKEENIILKYFNNNILIDLLNERLLKSFKDNQLYCIIPLNYYLIVYGKYKFFRALYILQLLNRRPVNKNLLMEYKIKYGNIHSPTNFYIPKYTDDLFSSVVLPISKQLYDMDLSTITYTVVARNFSVDVADKVYVNYKYKLKNKIEMDFTTIDDIIYLLKNSNNLHYKIKQYGFISTDDIRYELQLLNEERKDNHQPFINVKDGDAKFVTRMVMNIVDIKQTLNEMDLQFTKLDKKTIQNIMKYQGQQGEDITSILFLTNKIVMKKLIVKNKRKI